MEDKVNDQIIQAGAVFCTREKFAADVGLTDKTVYAMCDRGYLPTLRIGRRVFINLISVRKMVETQTDARLGGLSLGATL